MRRVTAAIAAGLLLVVAGCSGGGAPGTGTATTTNSPSPTPAVADTPTPTDAPASNQTPAGGLTTGTLDRVELRLERTVMGHPPTTVRGNVSVGVTRTTLRRDIGDNRTTHEVTLPSNWSRRLVRNLDDERATEPDNVTVVSDYEETFTATLYFETTTVVVRTSRYSGPDSMAVTVGDEPTYYSDDEELEQVVGQLYTRLSTLEDT
ncbi:hypothetical protein EGH22_15160 [Halomicroarcula sp. F28]|uniref:hypothetical protein n=1 Tax=Haloarcula salinisoli TaxID=2487746 RepID=UPI001C72F5F6|nr:hypothetical protein [Halomicroarcula salinisoli]MBX0287672.1 hypothetical protein [Halomicroarcula salinisoli]